MRRRKGTKRRRPRESITEITKAVLTPHLSNVHNTSKRLLWASSLNKLKGQKAKLKPLRRLKHLCLGSRSSKKQLTHHWFTGQLPFPSLSERRKKLTLQEMESIIHDTNHPCNGLIHTNFFRVQDKYKTSAFNLRNQQMSFKGQK